METISSSDNNRPGSYLVFFDLDRTLTSSISGKVLARAAYKKDLLSRWDIINAVFLSLLFRLRLRDPLKILDKMVSWVRGIPENSMTELCSEVFHEVILPTVHKDAISEIKFHKLKNARSVILSSALTGICQAMADNLNIDDIICSELEVENGYLTGRPVGLLCFGAEKAVRLKDYCEKNNCSLADAWYYGDSISDFSALNSVGNPVCVNPDNKLRKAAIKKGWKIVFWND